jgi:hypothetical protein
MSTPMQNPERHHRGPCPVPTPTERERVRRIIAATRERLAERAEG